MPRSLFSPRLVTRLRRAFSRERQDLTVTRLVAKIGEDHPLIPAHHARANAATYELGQTPGRRLVYGWIHCVGRLSACSGTPRILMGFTHDQGRPPLGRDYVFCQPTFTPDNRFHFNVFLPPDARDVTLTLQGGEQVMGQLVAVSATMLTRQEALIREGAQLLLRRRLGPKRLAEVTLRAARIWRQSGVTGLLERYSPGAPRGHRAGQMDYEAWIEAYDAPSEERRKRAASRVAQLQSPCLVTVVMPVYNAPAVFLERAVQSLRDQAYSHWQLVVVDDASDAPDVAPLLQRLAHDEPRIEVITRTQNGHISRATNDALDAAKGDWIVFFDQDDELASEALLRVVEVAAVSPRAEVIYSDEDKIDAFGRRHAPFFKPDWDPVMLRSQNYLNHLTAVRTETVRRVGGLRIGFEGAQDHDFLLRVTETLPRDAVCHVAEVLYHWRAIPGSTAHTRTAKAYVQAAALRAVTEHMERIKRPATVTWEPPGVVRVTPQLPPKLPRASLIVPTRDRVELLSTCVDSILAETTYSNFEILIVDNDSQKPETAAYFKHIEQDPRVRVLRYAKPFNYSAINNFAAAHATGELIGLINNDLEVITPEWLSELVAQALVPEVGAVGAILYYPHGEIQHAGVILGIGGVAGHAHRFLPREDSGYFARAKIIQGYAAVTAACLLIRRETFERVAGLDETLAVAFNDVDFCLRVRALGLTNVFTPYAELWHHESATRGNDVTPTQVARAHQEVALMKARWGELLENDPHYNRNLSLITEDFALATPPRRPRSVAT